MAPTSPLLTSRDAAIVDLRAALRGSLFLPDDDAFAAAWQPWLLGVPHAPAAIVVAESADDIAASVTFARDHDLPVAVHATGHGAVASVDGGLLINTERMKGYTVDPAASLVRVEPGVKWSDLLGELHRHKLGGLIGSSSDVGVIGYSLIGGVGWLARKYGYAADRIVAADLITADGERLHVTAETHPDLFWAIRGGGGNFGIVTSLDVGLVPFDTYFGGATFYDMEDAPQLFAAFAEWVKSVPEDVTSSMSLLRLPPLPFVPPALQGKKTVAFRACGVSDDSERLIAPMRHLAPAILDSFGRRPFTEIDLVSTTPLEPLPEVSSSCMLRSLTPEGISALLDLAGANADFPLFMVEVRHIDGAAHRMGFDSSCGNRHDVPFHVFAIGALINPEANARAIAAHGELAAVLEPFTTGYTFANNVRRDGEIADLTRRAYAPEIYARLQRIKAKYDPGNRFRFNWNIPPAT